MDPQMSGGGDTLLYRVGELESNVRALQKDGRLVGKHEVEINGTGGLNERVKENTEELKSVRRALYAFALGLPIAGITFLLGVLALVNP